MYFDKSYERARHERRELSVMLSIRIQTVRGSSIEILHEQKYSISEYESLIDVSFIEGKDIGKRDVV